MVQSVTGVLSAWRKAEVDGAKYAEAEINKKGIWAARFSSWFEDSANASAPRAEDAQADRRRSGDVIHSAT